MASPEQAPAQSAKQSTPAPEAKEDLSKLKVPDAKPATASGSELSGQKLYDTIKNL